MADKEGREIMSRAARRELRRAALAGGSEAKASFRALWLAYWPRMLAFSASWLSHSAADAEGAAQEILIRAFLGLKSYDPERELEPWLFATGRRYLAGLERSEARRARRERRSFGLDAPISASYEGEEERIVGEDELRRMKRALGDLKPRDRALVELFYDENLSSEDIGEALGMAAGTVRWRLAAIRKFLRERMEAGDGRG
jgi:RNA polymerase sigma-70 factor, ECF subfamily